MHFRAPHPALKQKNDHNSPYMPPIISFFQGLFKFMKRHLLNIFSNYLNVFWLFYRHAFKGMHDKCFEIQHVCMLLLIAKKRV